MKIRIDARFQFRRLWPPAPAVFATGTPQVQAVAIALPQPESPKRHKLTREEDTTDLRCSTSHSERCRPGR